jgi:trimethylamine:corrinoid methyltransferase-like protein
VAQGGNFLGERHTMLHARDFWLPGVFPRESYEQWLQGGKRGIVDIAHDRVVKILDENQLELQIDDEKAAAIDELVKRRFAELGETAPEVI